MKRALDSVNEKIIAAFNKRLQTDITANSMRMVPRLVAVSKLKPASSIIEAYEYGQRSFGENYIQELVEKSNSLEIIERCPNIKFHFIGHIQSNKVGKLLKVRNLHMVETVDSRKLADLLDKAINKHQLSSDGEQSSSEDDASSNKTKYSFPKNHKLRVMIQVNTSGEEQKNGIQPEEAPALAEHIVGSCKWLDLAGIMTIGKYDGWGEGVENKDFKLMAELGEVIGKKLPLDHPLELSMGMSSDFEEAISMGSTSVRIGTMIFGERPPKASQ